jgi:hypothetical protein
LAIHLNGLLDAGKDPWDVLVQEVMMLGLGKSTNDNEEEEDLLHGSDRGNEERVNKSPSPFSSSVADYFYQWRWGNYPAASAVGDSSTPVRANAPAGITTTTRPLFLPRLNCVLPLLKPLEEILPKQCLDLPNICKLW